MSLKRSRSTPGPSSGIGGESLPSKSPRLAPLSPKTLNSPPKSPRRSPRRSSGAFIPADAPATTDRSGNTNNFFPLNIRSVLSKNLQGGHNRCYRNATLQCLMHIPAFYYFVQELHDDCEEGVSKCVVCALKMLTKVYWDESEVELTGFRNQAAGLPPRHTNIFHRACLESARVFCQPEELRQDFEDDEQADPRQFIEFLFAWMSRSNDPRQQIKRAEMFDLITAKTYTCQDCGETRTAGGAQQVSLGLAVQISKLKATYKYQSHEYQCEWALTQYLDASISERLTASCDSSACVAQYGQDKYRPEREITEKMVKLPKILVVRLDRFAQKMREDAYGDWYVEGVKDSRTVIYTDYLNLGPYMEAGVEENQMYRLDGVVAHAGDGPDSGHYIAAVRAADSKTFDVINDLGTVQRNVSVWQMFDPIDKYWDPFNAYLLMYSKL